jgi:hypothetical protein
MASTDNDVHALHRYLIWSIHMRDECLQLKNVTEIPDDPLEKRLWLIRPFMWLALWLALPYVVAEGYEDLGLSDPVIDEMLASQNLDLLRRFEMGHFIFSVTISIGALPMFGRQRTFETGPCGFTTSSGVSFSSGTNQEALRLTSSKNQRSNQATHKRTFNPSYAMRVPAGSRDSADCGRS